MSETVDYRFFEALARITGDTDNKLRQAHTDPAEVRQLKFSCNARRASQVLGISPSHFSALKNMPEAPSGTILGNNRRNYSLADLENFRELLIERGALKYPPRRREHQPCVTFAVSNLKGGVSKTTLATNLATHLALHGYRTLLVDLDPQGSATGILNPYAQLHLDAEDTVLSALTEDPRLLEKAIIPTAWAPLLDLVSAMPDLHFAEWQMIDQTDDATNPFWSRLKTALDTVEKNYDAIIIDTPPSLSTLNLGAVWAADWMLIPVQPSWVDNRAMKAFFQNLAMYLKNIDQSIGERKEFAGIRVFLSNYKGPKDWTAEPANASLEHTIAGIMRRMLGETMADSVLPHSPAFRTAAAQMMTLHELPMSDKTNKRALEAFWELGNEVISLLESWRCRVEKESQSQERQA